MNGDARVLTRRRFLQAGAAVGLAAMPILGARAAVAGAAPRGAAAVTLDFSDAWRFGGPLTAGATQPSFDDSGYELVTLPHTVTKLSWREWNPSAWERQWIYRRHFDAPNQIDGLRVFLDFEGAMTRASLTLNGTDLGDHYGGYLPFSREVTDTLHTSGNVLAVALDSTFDVNTPPDRPGQPSTSVDFWQPGGLYRAATLRAVPQAFLADVFARPVNVLDGNRSVAVQATVDTAQPLNNGSVKVDLRRNGAIVATASAPVTADQPGKTTVELTLDKLGDIALWDVEHPNLYDVVAILSTNGTAVHDYTTRIGFRDARFTLDGFFLNGSRVKLFGVNRHQFFPFAGGAMPARVQRRDAEITRRTLNSNMVRCSHYPQASAFYDACDELGLMAWEEAAGWGAYIGDQDWQDRVVDDVRNMVLRDRNHPSIVIWGARLNENNDDVPLWTKTRDTAHELDPSRPTVGAMAGRHNTTQYVQDVFSQNDYSTKNGQPSLQAPRTDRPYMVSEAIGTLNGPAKFYRRTDPLAAQQGQAVAHGQVHELAAADDRYCGLLAWSGFDYPSGSGNQYQGVKYTGVVDLFREPKPGAAIYRSQVDPSEQPVIEPAFYWDFGPKSPANGPGAGATICSNCERLELFVDGKPFATVEPDRQRFGHLRYPPSFVDLTVDGSGKPELRIDGFVGGEKVLSRSFSSDPAGDRLAVAADDSELAADGADATRVAFKVVDRYGAPRPYPTGGDVTIDVAGPGQLVGDSPFPFEEVGGVGATWIRSRSNQPGKVTVTVTHGTLGSGVATIAMRQVAGAGGPSAAADLHASAAPALVKPGGTTTVTATLTNTGRIELDDVKLTLTTPSGWSAEATSPTRFAAIDGGQAATSTWKVTAPDGADPGAATVVANAIFTAAGQTSGERDEVALLVPTTLEKAFDNAGISDDSNVDQADLDGVGNSYSQQALTAAGLPPGAQVVHDGVSFTWPDVASGQPDNVLADGQTLELSGAGSRLAFLGCTSRGPLTKTGTVHYQDGTSASFSLTLDDYFSPPPGAENDTIAKMPYLNSQGIGGRVRGQRVHDTFAFYAAVPLADGKAVAGVTLPTVGDTVQGGPSAMHVFAIAVG
jgi:beta-galactosidase